MKGEPKALHDKVVRVTRERDEMATQASACAEEVDRVRVEIGAVQVENESLKAELAAVNNEFGSQTPNWPEAWKRVADLKQLAGDRWRDNVDLKEQVHVLREDLTRVLAERNEARTALAESERKRVEAEAALTTAITRLQDIAEGRAFQPRLHAMTGLTPIRFASTPTQETTHVEG